MHDPWSLIWPHVDALDPLLSLEAFVPWSPVAFEGLLAAGWLCEAHNAETVTCPACGDHAEEVLCFECPDGSPQFFIYCPENLRIPVAEERLRQWTVNFEVIAATVAMALCLSGRGAALEPGRLWRLGRTKWQGVARDVLFARGLHWSDGAGIARRIAHSTRPIVLVSDRIPPTSIWPGRVPPVVALAQVARSNDNQLEIDYDAVVAAIFEADDQCGQDAAPTLDTERLKVLIRQQVKAEEKSQLSDDLLVAAYRQEGSVRKAAAFLAKQTGQMVTKDKVQAAVMRAGGAAAVARGDDSESVVRTVASQRRDRSKKIMRKPELNDGQ